MIDLDRLTEMLADIYSADDVAARRTRETAVHIATVRQPFSDGGDVHPVDPIAIAKRDRHGWVVLSDHKR